MAILTRRERDAVVGLATAFIIPFLAGFLSYETATGVIVYDYNTASGLAILAFVAFLVYRALRRAVRAVRSRGATREVA